MCNSQHSNASAAALVAVMAYRTCNILLHPQYGSSKSLVADPDIVRTVLTVFWMLAEPVRLMAGYYGNLEENVSIVRLCHW